MIQSKYDTLLIKVRGSDVIMTSLCKNGEISDRITQCEAGDISPVIGDFNRVSFCSPSKGGKLIYNC